MSVFRSLNLTFSLLVIVKTCYVNSYNKIVSLKEKEVIMINIRGSIKLIFSSSILNHVTDSSNFKIFSLVLHPALRFSVLQVCLQIRVYSLQLRVQLYPANCQEYTYLRTTETRDDSWNHIQQHEYRCKLVFRNQQILNI